MGSPVLRIPGRARRRRALVALSFAAAIGGAVLPAGTATAAPPPPSQGLGPNVVVFDPSMPQADIQAKVDAIAAQQVSDQFSTRRYALLFKPGTYGTTANPLVFQVGYYTEVAGLGQNPDDVTINGAVNVYDSCADPNDANTCNALNNFWRSVSNVHIAFATDGGCHGSNEFWAVSQAAPMRRVHLTNGALTLFDYCGDPNPYASGGFLADSSIDGTVINGSQQQFYARNTAMGAWSNDVWNQVFSGDVGAPAQSFPKPAYTTLPSTPVSKEKPYLTADPAGRYSVVVPGARTDSIGTDWPATTATRTIPLSDFFVATPSDGDQAINNALARGKNLLLTPGIYHTRKPIEVKRAGTVVLGLGLATIEPDAGNIALTTADVPGVDIAGLLLDAGPQNSPVLLQVGSRHAGRGAGNPHASDPAAPTALQDVFFRVGGAHLGRATTSLEVNADHTVLDDIWAWRADHGTGVGWTVNQADDGVVVNGDDVTATGLAVEHYQKYNVLWNGERGETIFFQNELPYDAPNQAAWSHDGEPGYPGYTVARTVRTHTGYGMGTYIYTPANPSLHAANGFEVPNSPGVQMHDLLTVSLNAAGTIDHVINGVGAPVTPTFQGPSDVVAYP